MSYAIGFLLGVVVTLALMHFAIKKFGLVIAHRDALNKRAVKATKKDLGL